jgi:cellobiose phosphorylase
VDNYDTNRDAFLGAGNGNAFPEAVCKKKCSNSIASGWYPIAAHQIDLTLLPGEEKEFVFMPAVFVRHSQCICPNDR